jgi:hypothetical protein
VKSNAACSRLISQVLDGAADETVVERPVVYVRWSIFLNYGKPISSLESLLSRSSARFE